jgi:hypothetical protein
MVVNHCNSRYLTDLPVADVDVSICIDLKQMILRALGSDSQKCPIVFVGVSE